MENDLTAQVIWPDMEYSFELGFSLRSVASHLAHEINQPLGAIENYAGALSRRIVASDVLASEVLAKIETIRIEVKRAAEVIAGMRSGIAKMPDERRIVDFHLIIIAAVDRIKSQLQAKHAEKIRFEVECLGETARAWGNPAALTYALFNVLINSVDALESPWPGPKLITIRMQVEDGVIDLTIADTGPGISEDIELALFTPFATTKPGHHGLGLSVTRDILTAHGGSIISVPHSGGAIFNVLFPIFGRNI